MTSAVVIVTNTPSCGGHVPVLLAVPVCVFAVATAVWAVWSAFRL